jgi:hypothetical protein
MAKMSLTAKNAVDSKVKTLKSEKELRQARKSQDKLYQCS